MIGMDLMCFNSGLQYLLKYLEKQIIWDLLSREGRNY